MKKTKLYADFKPFKWQIEFHKYMDWVYSQERTFNRIILLNSPRQDYGKSECLINELIRVSIENERVTSLFAGPTVGLCKQMFQRCKDNGSFWITSSTMSPIMEINFFNKSRILFKTADNPLNFKGFTVDGVLIFDESIDIKDDAYSYAKYLTNTTKAPIIMASNPDPHIEQGFFWNFYKEATNNPNHKFIKLFNWSKEYPIDDTSENIITRIESETGGWPKVRSQIYGLWPSEDPNGIEGGLFRYKKCLYEGTLEFKKLYFGIDFGAGDGGDYTVITALNEKKEQLFIYRWNTLDINEQVLNIKDILEPYKGRIGKVCCDATASGGKAFRDLLKNTGYPFNWITFTNKSKENMITNLRTHFEKQQIKILADKDQIEEFDFMKVEKSQSGNYKYNSMRGKKDDMVTALYLALEGFNNNKPTFMV